ncbi:paraoxonase 2 [Paraphoma chrysanthemicola]|nr:paraoxonase 2 [Paraphoma chrysanthemicola]
MACEDVKFHYPTNTAFLACGNLTNRMEWYPAGGFFAPPKNKVYHEYFLKYDVDSNVTTRLSIENWNPEEDLVLHGLDIWQSEQKDELFVYAVNHKQSGESIALFSHTLGTNTLHLVKQYTHRLIRTPNQVTAAGPREFFITNDHYFYSGAGRRLEETYGPFSWASSIAYCAESKGNVVCKQVSPANSHAYANGLLMLDDGKTLAVADVVAGSISLYNIDSDTKMLSLGNAIVLGASPDNLSQVSDTGDLIVAVIPNEEALYARFMGGGLLDHTIPIPAAVLRLVKAKGFAPEVLYWDDGSLISILTSGAVDKERGLLVAGGVFERHFIVCKIEY